MVLWKILVFQQLKLYLQLLIIYSEFNTHITNNYPLPRAVFKNINFIDLVYRFY